MVEEDKSMMKAKVAVLGDSGVGKSCLIAVFSAIAKSRPENYDEILSEALTTVGCDFVAVPIVLEDGKAVKLNIWDTAGQEKYRSINRNLYLGANGVMLCFDLTSKLSTENVEVWKKEVDDHAGAKCCIMIVGTKADMEICTETKVMLESYSKANGFQFIETSAKTGNNVQEAFHIILADILSKDPKFKPERPQDEDNGFHLVPEVSKTGFVAVKKKCC